MKCIRNNATRAGICSNKSQRGQRKTMGVFKMMDQSPLDTILQNLIMNFQKNIRRKGFYMKTHFIMDVVDTSQPLGKPLLKLETH